MSSGKCHKKKTKTLFQQRDSNWIETISVLSENTNTFHFVRLTLKGTQDWEFFWLRFWNLRYFFVSHVKILRFYQKIFWIGPFLGEVRFFRVVLGLRGMEKIFELGQKNIFFFLMNPLYELIPVFSKIDPLTAPGMALCVNLGPKCQNLFCLVWD